MSIDLENIIAVASAVKPTGSFEVASTGKSYLEKKIKYVVAGYPGVSDYEDWGFTKESAQFIATCNPSTVLEMAREIESQKAEIQRLESCLKKSNDKAEHFEREWYLLGDENEALRKDAARYRFLRNSGHVEAYLHYLPGVDNCKQIGGDGMDAAIDAAMGE